jgi:hypothetical protein
MTRRNQNIIAVAVITPLWLAASLVLCMELVGAEDPGLPIGEIVNYVDGHEVVSMDPNYKGDHQGEFAPVPPWLKTANVVAMPMLYIFPQDGFKGLSDHANGLMALFEMFVSSVLWGFLIVSTFRLCRKTISCYKEQRIT